MFKYCFYTEEMLDYLTFKTHLFKDDQIEVDDIDSLIDWICDDIMYSYIEDTDNLGIEYNGKRITIEHFKNIYEDYFPETWEEYCASVNAKFYPSDCGLEDRDNHIEKYEEQEEMKAEKLVNKIMETVIEGFNLKDNGKVYKLTIDKDEEDDYNYFHNINIINTLTNEKETINLGFDFYAEDVHNGYWNNGYDSRMYHNTLFRICGYPSEDELYVKEGDLFTKSEIEDIRNRFEFVQKEYPDMIDRYIVDIEKISNGVRFYLGTKEQFENSYGDDWNDCPYDCNAGTVYDKYVSKVWDWMPSKKLDVQAIEDYLMNDFNPHIDKFMMKRGIVPAIIITDNSKKYNREHKNDYPIFFGMTSERLRNILEKELLNWE